MADVPAQGPIADRIADVFERELAVANTKSALTVYSDPSRTGPNADETIKEASLSGRGERAIDDDVRARLVRNQGVCVFQEQISIESRNRRYLNVGVCTTSIADHPLHDDPDTRLAAGCPTGPSHLGFSHDESVHHFASTAFCADSEAQPGTSTPFLAIVLSGANFC